MNTDFYLDLAKIQLIDVKKQESVRHIQKIVTFAHHQLIALLAIMDMDMPKIIMASYIMNNVLNVLMTVLIIVILILQFAPIVKTVITL